MGAEAARGEWSDSILELEGKKTRRRRSEELQGERKGQLEGIMEWFGLG